MIAGEVIMAESDLISRQAAKDAINRKYRMRKDSVIATINRLPAADVVEAVRWIPCSDRLPEARRSVILSTKNWTGEGCYWETTAHHVIWKGYRWNATYLDDEVIAWVPLPEPYKGEKL